MSVSPEVERGLKNEADRSEMDPVVVTPGSEADPSAAPEWKDHVQDYFNQDAIPGEALPAASHEAKEAEPAGEDQS